MDVCICMPVHLSVHGSVYASQKAMQREIQVHSVDGPHLARTIQCYWIMNYSLYLLCMLKIKTTSGSCVLGILTFTFCM